jgi:hypothetical protein
MRLCRVAALIVLALAVLTSTAQESPPRITDLNWLAGSWQTHQDNMDVEEHWTLPVGGTMIGMGRTVAKGKTVFFEYLRIEARTDGLYYVAQPKGRPPTDFKAIEMSPDKVVFSNPLHDFPKRIIYGKNADGTVWARIEGDATSKEKAEEFHYGRL